VHHGHHEHASGLDRAAASPSATLAIFDSSLSVRTRTRAFVLALAINFALPFVNGVMLGFGEIFAKNYVVRWFGWRVPGTAVATNVGIGVPTRGDQRRRM